nr:retrovirus-related Pol polyprotein from transposon TNT 1-94 [Tanacetum cinerariifolium]
CIHDNVDDLIESALNSQLLSINSQRLDNKEQEVKNVVEQPAKRGNRSIESLQNFRVIRKSSISLKNTSQISPVHAIAPILSTKEPEYSPSMGYEHPNTTPETESDEIIKSGVEELVPVLSENEHWLDLRGRRSGAHRECEGSDCVRMRVQGKEASLADCCRKILVDPAFTSNLVSDIKQTALAIFTTEAEYVSTGKAYQQALWMKQALVDYGV